MTLDVGAEHEERRRHLLGGEDVEHRGRRRARSIVERQRAAFRRTDAGQAPADSSERIERRHAAERLVGRDGERRREQQQAQPQRRRRRHERRRRPRHRDHRQRGPKDPIAKRRTHADDCTLHAIWHTVAASTATPLDRPARVMRPRRWRSTSSASSSPARAGADSCARSARETRRSLRATLATLGGIAAGNLTPTPGGEACRIALLRMPAGAPPGRRRRSRRFGIGCRSCRLILAPIGDRRRPPVRSMAPAGGRQRSRSPSLAIGWRLPHSAFWRVRGRDSGCSAGVKISRRITSAAASIRRRRRLFVAALAAGLPAADVRHARVRRGAVARADRDAVDPGDARRCGACGGGARTGRGRVWSRVWSRSASICRPPPRSPRSSARSRTGSARRPERVVIGVMGGRSMWRRRADAHAPDSEADAARS